MSGIPKEVAEHALEIQAGSRPVKQRLRTLQREEAQGHRRGDPQAFKGRIHQGGSSSRVVG
jgi:hypothetical protein